MQNAKDSFYMALRTRLVAINPERTTLLRGASRPGILVEDAEAPFSVIPNDIFILRWQGLGMDVTQSTDLAASQCEISYQTCGTQEFGGLDRGRKMTVMDGEILSILRPFYTAKLNYSASPAKQLLSNVFWSAPVIGPLCVQRYKLSRSALVTIYSFEEKGE